MKGEVPVNKVFAEKPKETINAAKDLLSWIDKLVPAAAKAPAHGASEAEMSETRRVR